MRGAQLGGIVLMPTLSTALYNRFHTIADMLNVSNLLFLRREKTTTVSKNDHPMLQLNKQSPHVTS